MTPETCRIRETKTAIIAIGTPVDEFLNPDFGCFRRWVESNLPFLSDEHILILRSTVYPGTTEWLHTYLRKNGKQAGIAYCPERIVQGYAVEELQRLPQVISSTTPAALDAARRLFGTIAPEVVEMKPMEAEFSKLFANVYRYQSLRVEGHGEIVAVVALSHLENLRGFLEERLGRLVVALIPVHMAKAPEAPRDRLCHRPEGLSSDGEGLLMELTRALKITHFGQQVAEDADAHCVVRVRIPELASTNLSRLF